MSTLANLESQFRLETKVDPNAKLWSTTTSRQHINSAILKTVRDTNFDISDQKTDTDISIVSGTAEYSLPSDFARATLVEVDGDELQLITPQEAVKRGSSTGKAQYYYLKGGNIGLYPTPNQGTNIEIEYNKLPGTLTNDTDDDGLPAYFADSIVKYAAYLAFSSINRYRAEAQEKIQDYNLALSTVRQIAWQPTDDDMRLKLQRTNRTRYQFGGYGNHNYYY